ncbi:EF-P lysine aminoacylase EpmA [Thioalkalivibrio sp. XN279]|uniref:EF-P lysine aminoacylase EpmA n=1 Tax=Thioalkalivibrio sp. XN279 TaxID=2714953 RepID=UPI0014075613|nr:EF-P lysine aminoacylase GenX [Thioalkalivibrio sp. XN279]
MPTSPASSNSPSWQPTASLEALRLRARLLAETRAFFDARGLLEVETPQLSTAAATDLHLESLQARAPGGGLDGWLHTSPEFPMKRLLAAGSGDCWQLARVFRGGEHGRRHNPEFSLLEWYRVGWDATRLMDEVEAFVRALAAGRLPLQDALRLSYREAFRRHAGLDPFGAAAGELAAALEARAVQIPQGVAQDRDALLDLALALLVEPALDPAQPTFIHDFPASHAALARIRPGDPPVAERFELFLGGMELANGFCELTDATEQRARFAADLDARRRRGLATLPLDERLLAALAHGLPACSGVALGFDRLVMLLAGAEDIRDVLAFGWGRA